ncbi:MAG: hypothetical protein ACKPKO_14970, partial [Candidatus Fonsibacter sp.]
MDWAKPDEDDDEGIGGGEGPQALATEPQAEADPQEALEDNVLLPHREAEPPMGPYIHEQHGMNLPTDVEEDVLASNRDTTPFVLRGAGLQYIVVIIWSSSEATSSGRQS